MTERSPDLDTEYVNAEGEVRTWKNIALLVRHEKAEVERVEDGFLINGERYTQRSCLD